MQARRGYLPKDDRYFSSKALATLREASEHVRYLIDHGYDLKQASTFVGDHFQLSERQRTAIVRSVATDAQLRGRRAKEVAVEDLRDREVWIDGFNAIITLEVMLSDSTLLLCMDGTVRDLAALRGTYRIIPVTTDAVRLLFDVLGDALVRRATILLDEPVSNSGRLKALLAELGEAYPFALDIRVLGGVDRTLYGKECVISSDSVILDRCVSWANITRHCMDLLHGQALRIW
jgi:hypothetical protein